MDREQLVGHGYIVGRGLLQARRGELGVPLLAGRKASKLTKDGHLRLSSAWQSNCAVWARVHAERSRVGELGREGHHAERGAESSAGAGTTFCSARAGGRPGGRGGQGCGYEPRLSRRCGRHFLLAWAP